MRFQQSKDIIHHAISLHRQVERHFAALGQRTTDPRLKMISDYLVKREVFLQKGLSEFEAVGAQSVEQTWFKFSDCQTHFHDLEARLNAATEGSADEVVELTVQLYECLAAQFTAFAAESDVEGVRAIFQNLADMEKRELKKLVRNLQMMNEL